MNSTLLSTRVSVGPGLIDLRKSQIHIMQIVILKSPNLYVTVKCTELAENGNNSAINGLCQRLKSTFYEIFSSLLCRLFRSRSIRKKKLAFDANSAASIKCTFSDFLAYCEVQAHHQFLSLMLD